MPETLAQGSGAWRGSSNPVRRGKKEGFLEEAESQLRPDDEKELAR